jgi:drug/metabolite transporter (DMT)-like permease
MIAAEFIAALSQVLLKKSAQREHTSFITEYLNPLVIGGYGLLMVSMLLTIYSNTGLEYMAVVLLEAMSYIMVMIMSRIVFKEKITRFKFIGMCLIILGIVVFNV